MKRLQAELVADAIRTVAKAEAMYYAAKVVAREGAPPAVLDALDAKRTEARDVLVRVLETMDSSR